MAEEEEEEEEVRIPRVDLFLRPHLDVTRVYTLLAAMVLPRG